MSLRSRPINNEFKQNKRQVLKRIVEVAKDVAPLAIPAAFIVAGAILGGESSLWWMYNHDMPLEIAKCGAHPEASWFVSHLWVKQLEYGGSGAVVGGFLGAAGFVYAADAIDGVGYAIKSRLRSRKKRKAERKNAMNNTERNDGPRFG